MASDVKFEVPSGGPTAGDGTIPAHRHAQSDIVNLEGALAGKAAAEHRHAISEVSGLAEDLSAIEQSAAAATAAVEQSAADIRAARQEATAAVTAATGAAQVAQAAKTESGDALNKAQQALTAAPKLEAGANISISDNAETGAKIISATGGGTLDYTVNHTSPDENGNFNLTAELLNAAPAAHQHAVTSITGLSAALSGKADSGHTHELVSGIQIGNSVISGAVQVAPGDNVAFDVVGNTITINVNAAAAGAAAAVQNLATADGTTLKVFVGTAAQWEAFAKVAGVKYQVFIVES
ncbi:hypothetical protein [Victivallis sp. Marseille-Q1083]|uniref:hypothetical protein n=1 Tax=Victivallis sp. Marseille-Q1083 TaxID=2717288 RepID=UPI00158BE31F|nr:hypothetical protein [Victivallis sp. Marseille-Q1083]